MNGLKVSKLALPLFFALGMASGSTCFSPGVERNAMGFLQTLTQGGGNPIEQLSPKDAHAVLVGAQKGAQLLPAKVSKKTIIVNREKLELATVKPKIPKARFPPLCISTEEGDFWVATQLMNA
jgi:hypothetical protein